jgi:hypothetical protein
LHGFEGITVEGPGFDEYVSNISEYIFMEKYRHKAEVLLRVNGVLTG